MLRIFPATFVLPPLLLFACDARPPTPSPTTTAPAQAPAPSAEAPPAPISKPDAKGLVTVTNQRCPLMPANPIKNGRALPEQTRTFEGQLIGFCCEDCAQGWDAMADDDRRTALANASKHP